MTRWYAGNAGKDGGENRSWLVGHFKDPNDVRWDSDVEIKVSTHEAGDRRPEWVTREVRRTFLLLVGGRHRVDLFVDGQVESVVLAEPGDYAMWDRGIGHTYEVLETPTTLVTVRWPSFPPESPGA